MGSKRFRSFFGDLKRPAIYILCYAAAMGISAQFADSYVVRFCISLPLSFTLYLGVRVTFGVIRANRE